MTSAFLENKDYDSERLVASVTAILDANRDLAMATVMGNQSYINTAHYAYNSAAELVILTQPHTQHGKNLEENPSIAVAIWNSPDEPGTNLQGLQLFGVCYRVDDTTVDEALRIYSARFRDFGEFVKTPSDFVKTDSRLYVIRVHSLKLLDEPTFGRRNYITANVTGH